MIREAGINDLPGILKLYLHLHEKSIPEDSENLQRTWKKIIDDPNHHLILLEQDEQIVSSCVCIVIPNLTRNVSPYALVENVVTQREYRGKGYASKCLEYASQIAQEAGCYKIMLLTGAKDENTLSFYCRAGFNSTDKTAFIKWLEPKENECSTK